MKCAYKWMLFNLNDANHKATLQNLKVILICARYSSCRLKSSLHWTTEGKKYLPAGYTVTHCTHAHLQWTLQGRLKVLMFFLLILNFLYSFKWLVKCETPSINQQQVHWSKFTVEQSYLSLWFFLNIETTQLSKQSSPNLKQIMAWVCESLGVLRPANKNRDSPVTSAERVCVCVWQAQAGGRYSWGSK